MSKKKSKIIIDPQQYSNIYDHTKSELLQITTDKLKLKLKEYESSLKHKNRIISSIGQILAILLVFATSNFREFLGFSADTWQAVFIVILGLLVILFLCSLIMWLIKIVTTDTIIEDFRKKK